MTNPDMHIFRSNDLYDKERSGRHRLMQNSRSLQPLPTKMNKYSKWSALLLSLALLIGMTGCSEVANSAQESINSSSFVESDSSSYLSLEPDSDEEKWIEDESTAFTIPDYEGNPYIEVNGNQPSFTDDQLKPNSYESYSELDSLGRCGVAEACVGVDTMPTQDRESISEVRPSGWENEAYDFVDGGYVYNRCHLIGFQLTGENANEKNLITGTRYMNTEGMLPFENMVADYVQETENHVLYRVTPIFEGENLVASGVLMEAKSVEDNGEGILFSVYCYNVQPGVAIDYQTGKNWADDASAGSVVPDKSQSVSESNEATSEGQVEVNQYVLNTNSKKFHYPTCSSAESISPENREEVETMREELLSDGYTPCGRCNP